MAKTSAKDTLLSNSQRREYGVRVRESNITACCIVADAVRSTLGPNGMDKLLIHKTHDITGNFIVTNDGATILEEMKLEHPAAKMVAEISQEQNEKLGDGTTTSTAFAGALLKNAVELLEDGVHPSTIASGYHQGAQRTAERLDELAFEVSLTDTGALQAVAETAMTGRVGDTPDKKIPRLIVRGLIQTKDDKIDSENLQVLSAKGGSIGDSELTSGLLLDKNVPSKNMPKKISDPKVAVIDGSISFDKGQYKRHWVNRPKDMTATVDTPEEANAFIEWKHEVAKNQIQKYLDVGVDAIFPVGYIDNKQLYYLSTEGILGIRQVDPLDLRRVAAATDARIVGEVDEITEEDLGSVDCIREVKVGSDHRILIENESNPRSVTLLLRASTEHTLSELERTTKDVIRVVCKVFNDNRVVTGAGATEMELARNLRRYAKSINTKEQLVIEAYADALEMLPQTLARNAGCNTIDTLVRLRNMHDAGNRSVGILADGSVADAKEAGIVEPLQIKKVIVEGATEVATQLLRVDGIIATEPLNQEEEDEYVERVEKGEEPEEALENVRS